MEFLPFLPGSDAKPIGDVGNIAKDKCPPIEHDLHRRLWMAIAAVSCLVAFNTWLVN